MQVENDRMEMQETYFSFLRLSELHSVDLALLKDHLVLSKSACLVAEDHFNLAKLLDQV